MMRHSEIAIRRVYYKLNLYNIILQRDSLIITGASGFVAKNLRRYMIQKYQKVISISRKNFSTYKNEKKILTTNYNEVNVINALKRCRCLIHLVGIGKQNFNTDFQSVNTGFTKNLVSEAKRNGVQKIIFLSGLGVDKKNNLSYFISKYLAEKIISNSGIDYTIFRPSFIVGKDDYLTKLLNKQIKSGRILIPGSGQYRLQPISIIDVCEIIDEAMNKKCYSKKTLDLVGPQIVSFKNYVKHFNKGRGRIYSKGIENVFKESIKNISPYGIDDLHLFLGDFTGDHQTLKTVSKKRFLKYTEFL